MKCSQDIAWSCWCHRCTCAFVPRYHCPTADILNRKSQTQCFNKLLLAFALVLQLYFCRTSAPQRLWSSSTHFFRTLIGWPMSTESTRWVSSAGIFEPALCLGFWLSCCTHGSGCQCASWMETGIAQHYEICYVGFQLCLWAPVEQVFMQLRWCCRKVCVLSY